MSASQNHDLHQLIVQDRSKPQVYRQTDFQSNLSSVKSEVFYESTQVNLEPVSMVANDSVENLSDSDDTSESNR